MCLCLIMPAVHRNGRDKCLGMCLGMCLVLVPCLSCVFSLQHVCMLLLLLQSTITCTLVQ